MVSTTSTSSLPSSPVGTATRTDNAAGTPAGGLAGAGGQKPDTQGAVGVAPQLSAQAVRLAEWFEEAGRQVREQYLQHFMNANGTLRAAQGNPADTAAQLLDQAAGQLLAQAAAQGITLNQQDIAGQLQADNSVFLALVTAGFSALSALAQLGGETHSGAPAISDADSARQIELAEATAALQRLTTKNPLSAGSAKNNKYADIEDSGLPESLQRMLKQIRDLKEQIRAKTAEIDEIRNDRTLDEKTRKAKLLKAQTELGVLIAALVKTMDMLQQTTMEMKSDGSLSEDQARMAGQLAAI